MRKFYINLAFALFDIRHIFRFRDMGTKDGGWN